MRVRGDLHTNTIRSAGVQGLTCGPSQQVQSFWIGLVKTGGVLPASSQSRRSSTQKPVSTQMKSQHKRRQLGDQIVALGRTTERKRLPVCPMCNWRLWKCWSTYFTYPFSALFLPPKGMIGVSGWIIFCLISSLPAVTRTKCFLLRGESKYYYTVPDSDPGQSFRLVTLVGFCLKNQTSHFGQREHKIVAPNK